MPKMMSPFEIGDASDQNDMRILRGTESETNGMERWIVRSTIIRSATISDLLERP